jgi:hypothetical protein
MVIGEKAGHTVFPSDDHAAVVAFFPGVSTDDDFRCKLSHNNTTPSSCTAANITPLQSHTRDTTVDFAAMLSIRAPRLSKIRTILFELQRGSERRVVCDILTRK